MKIRKILVLMFLGVCLFLGCKKNDSAPTPVITKRFDSPLATTFDVKFLADWTKVHLSLIKNTAGYQAPVAARSLGYTSLAAYESLLPGMPGYISMAGQLNGLSKLPQVDSTKEYNWGLVASTAQSTILKELFISAGDKNQRLIDSVRNIYEVKFKTGLNDAATQNSIKHGAALAVAILEYSKKDGGATGAVNNFPKNYEIPSGIGAWKPTSSQKIPLLPTWGKNRAFLTSNEADNIVDKPMIFSFEKASDYFKEVNKLLGQSKLLTEDQKKMAYFFENGQGTLSAPGHMFNIVNNLAIEKKYKVDQLAALYLKIGLALNDAMVTCWKSKYTSNTLRPQTYINEALDKNWKSLIATPPYPEYPSEHDVAAGVFYSIVEKEFAKEISFTDNSYEGTLPNRTYANIETYVQDIGSSRLFGGVQLPLSSTSGLKAGKTIGANVQKLKIKK
jgi:hypothetical protein